jgi:hypothetical protein
LSKEAVIISVSAFTILFIVLILKLAYAFLDCRNSWYGGSCKNALFTGRGFDNSLACCLYDAFGRTISISSKFYASGNSGRRSIMEYAFGKIERLNSGPRNDGDDDDQNDLGGLDRF